MGKQFKKLNNDDIKFINEQKLFYIASSSNAEVNLSPKGYDCIKVLDSSTIIFMSYPGSANRTYRDACNNGEFTLLFNDFVNNNGHILRVFCRCFFFNHKSAEISFNFVNHATPWLWYTGRVWTHLKVEQRTHIYQCKLLALKFQLFRENSRDAQIKFGMEKQLFWNV